jgi:hypothetical protein
VAQLAGQQGQAQQSGSASLQQQVIQKAMSAEQILNDIATILPAASGPISSIIDQLRKGVGMVLAKGAQPPPTQGMTGGSGLMSPSGGAGGAPTS